MVTPYNLGNFNGDHKSTVNEAIQIWETFWIEIHPLDSPRILGCRQLRIPWVFHMDSPTIMGKMMLNPKPLEFWDHFQSWMILDNVFVMMELRWIEIILDMKNRWENDSWWETYHDISIYPSPDFLRCGHPPSYPRRSESLICGRGPSLPWLFSFAAWDHIPWLFSEMENFNIGMHR